LAAIGGHWQPLAALVLASQSPEFSKPVRKEKKAFELDVFFRTEPFELGALDV
jgi:hypothetical protein